MIATVDMSHNVRYNCDMNEKPEQQRVTVVLPAALVAQMRQVAGAHHRSFTRELIVALEDYLERQKQADARNETTR